MALVGGTPVYDDTEGSALGAQERARHSSARRRALLYRGFASASGAYGRPRSLLRPHVGAIFDDAHLASARRATTCLPYAQFVAAAPAEPRVDTAQRLSPLALVAASSAEGVRFGAHKAAPVGGAGKRYPEPPFKGLLSAFKPTSLTITVVKCYGLSFGNLMFGAEMEEQTITDEQINAAHKASLELVLRELATTTLRRLLEKAAILALDPRWSAKLLKDLSASARRKAFRDGRLSAAGRIALTSLRASLLTHISTWTCEVLIDIAAMLRGKIKPKACAKLIVHRALNRLICALSGAAGASLLTLFFPGIGTFVGALLAESAAPYLTAALIGDAQQSP